MHPDPYGEQKSVQQSGGPSSAPSPAHYPQAPSFYPQQPPVPTYQQAPPPQPMYPQPFGYQAPMQPVCAGGAPFGIDPTTGIPFSDKTKVAAGLLQFFLGSFGVGRWYIGSNGVAAAQLCLWLFGLVTSIALIGIPILLGVGIWVLIDSIMMFTGSVRDGDGRVLR